MAAVTAVAAALRDLHQPTSTAFFPFAPEDNGGAERNDPASPLSLVDRQRYLDHTTTSLRQLLARPFVHFVANLVHDQGLATFVASYLAHRDRPYQHRPSPRLAELDQSVYLLHLRAVSINSNPSSSSSSGDGDGGAASCVVAADVLKDAPAAVAHAVQGTSAPPADHLHTQLATLLWLPQPNDGKWPFLSLPALMDVCALLGSNNAPLAALLLRRAAALAARCHQQQQPPAEARGHLAGPMRMQMAGVAEELQRLVPLLIADTQQHVAGKHRSSSSNAGSNDGAAPTKAGLKAVDLSLSKVSTTFDLIHRDASQRLLTMIPSQALPKPDRLLQQQSQQRLQRWEDKARGGPHQAASHGGSGPADVDMDAAWLRDTCAYAVDICHTLASTVCPLQVPSAP
jgi:hypothetical protein